MPQPAVVLDALTEESEPSGDAVILTGDAEVVVEANVSVVPSTPALEPLSTREMSMPLLRAKVGPGDRLVWWVEQDGASLIHADAKVLSVSDDGEVASLQILVVHVDNYHQGELSKWKLRKGQQCRVLHTVLYRPKGPDSN